MSLKAKLVETHAHASVNPDDITWITNELEAWVLGRYIKCDFLGDISMFLDKVAMSPRGDDLIKIEAESLSRRIRNNIILSDFKGERDDIKEAFSAG